MARPTIAIAVLVVLFATAVCVATAEPVVPAPQVKKLYASTLMSAARAARDYFEDLGLAFGAGGVAGDDAFALASFVNASIAELEYYAHERTCIDGKVCVPRGVATLEWCQAQQMAGTLADLEIADDLCTCKKCPTTNNDVRDALELLATVLGGISLNELSEAQVYQAIDLVPKMLAHLNGPVKTSLVTQAAAVLSNALAYAPALPGGQVDGGNPEVYVRLAEYLEDLEELAALANTAASTPAVWEFATDFVNIYVVTVSELTTGVESCATSTDEPLCISLLGMPYVEGDEDYMPATITIIQGKFQAGMGVPRTRSLPAGTVAISARNAEGEDAAFPSIVIRVPGETGLAEAAIISMSTKTKVPSSASSGSIYFAPAGEDTVEIYSINAPIPDDDCTVMAGFSCSACTTPNAGGDSSCGWCRNHHRCYEGNDQGPFGITSEECAGWVYDPDQCDPVLYEPPATEAPSTQTPTTQAPTTQAPTTQAPTTQAPTTQAPTTQAPTTQTPTTQAPTTQAPTTQAPTTQTPTTPAPTTQTPTTQAPTTQAPTTQTPTTQAPTTQAPTTEAPPTGED